MQIDRLVFPTEFKADAPVSKQIADTLKEGIVQGLVSPGIILPSVRDLAVQLNVSRSTAARAIEELSAQGYVVAEIGSGTRVASHLPGQIAGQNPRRQSEELSEAELKPVTLSKFGERLRHRYEIGALTTTVTYTGPKLKELPLSIWRDMIARHCRGGAENPQNYSPDTCGYPPLREAYASYLIRARAVKVTKERLITFASRNLRLDIVSRLILNEGDVVAMEEPGFQAAREQFLAAGARIVPVPVDSQGLRVDQLEALGEPVKLVFVTPSHHEPTGAVMSMTRRKQLLDYAERHNAYIVEDDYDSEFRYDGRPLPSLQGMDKNDRVIYLSCVWNVLAPLTRLGFMILPQALVEPVTACKNLVERDVAFTEQAALADFINEGHLEKLIRKLRSRYATRREALVRNIETTFKNGVFIAPESAGLDLLVRFDSMLGYSPEKIEKAARAAGLPLLSTAFYYMGTPRPLEYTIAFASIEDDADAIFSRFAAALQA